MRLVLAGILAALAFDGAAGAEFLWSDGKSSQVDALVVAHHMAPNAPPAAEVPSLSLVVGIDGRIVLAKGYGSAAPGLAASPNTVYHIGSLSKQFTAAAVLSLVERGAMAPALGAPLSLDTRVRLMFEDAERWEPAGQAPMTVRSLLTMTSNLPNFTRRPPPASDPWGMMPAPRLLSEIKKLVPSGWPNSFEYSNTSYFLLAEIVEAMSATKDGNRGGYRGYLRGMFARAGMDRTGFIGDYAEGSELAAPHFRRKPAFMQRDWLKGSGDVASSVLDIFAWTKALMEGGIVSESSRELTFSEAARVTPTQYYGMGWFVAEEDGFHEFSHSGSVPGFTSFDAIVRSHDKRSWASVTILTNSDGVEGLDVLARDIIRIARTP
jgi:CubicO group peptidase (beta-lactamase class C family)